MALRLIAVVALFPVVSGNVTSSTIVTTSQILTATSAIPAPTSDRVPERCKALLVGKEYLYLDVDKEVVWKSQLITMATLVISSALCLGTFGLAWASLYLIHFKIRRLHTLNEKVVTAELLLKRRKIPEKLLRRLSRLANFDVQKNDDETRSLLQSVSRKKDPKE